MQLFDPFTQCVDCLLGLAGNVPVLAGLENDPSAREGILEAARAVLMEHRDAGLTSPELAYLIFEKIQGHFTTEDPFQTFKKGEMSVARKVIARLAPVAESDLRACVSLAAVGNSLDFFQDPEEVLADIPEVIDRGLDFHYDQIARLEDLLEKGAREVVYLTDNAGEIYFDKALYDYIRERAVRTVLMVKGGPALNDLTRSELDENGLADWFDEIDDTGTGGAGINWRGASPHFLERLARADLILSKGMANFESLFTRPEAAKTFFLFRVKCKPIGDYVRAPIGSHVAMFGEG